MSVEEIIRGAIEQGKQVASQSLAETQRISDKMYKLLGDPDATVLDLHKEDDKPSEDVVG